MTDRHVRSPRSSIEHSLADDQITLKVERQSFMPRSSLRSANISGGSSVTDSECIQIRQHVVDRPELAA